MREGKIAIEYVYSDEARGAPFAHKINELLSRATGFDVWGYIAGRQPSGWVAKGVSIKVKKNHQSDSVGGGIQKAFDAIGIHAQGIFMDDGNQDYPDDRAIIFIGIKS